MDFLGHFDELSRYAPSKIPNESTKVQYLRELMNEQLKWTLLAHDDILDFKTLISKARIEGR